MKRKTIGIALSAMMLVGVGCGGQDQGPLDGVDSIVFLKRPARGGVGDIFQYNSYIPGGKLMKLSPPTADGELTVLCCDQPEFTDMDISSYDLSFDASDTTGEVVFSAKLSADQHYGLFIYSLETGEVEELPTDPNRDYHYPLFVPGDKIFYLSNAVVEEGAPQHQDEYERGTTLQAGVINRDGSNDTLGARNLSHRVFPTLLSDGRILLTQWDHLGDMNAGHLLAMHPDMSTVTEVYGKEGTGFANSYLKAREVAPGRLITIATARERTIQSGAIAEIHMGFDDVAGDDHPYADKGTLVADVSMSEANASYKVFTPQVPLGREPSSQTVGRYYDAFPLNAREYPDLLVSWADGPVEDGTLEAAGLDADFGIYVYDSRSNARRPIYNDPDTWDVFARPLAPRQAPPQIPSAGSNQFSDDAVLVGSMNVYDSSIADTAEGSIYGVRILEGFSTEEGIPMDFGLTEHEGAALLGVAPVQEDGSWAALVPPNVPVHLQTVDVYGMAFTTEPVWISGNNGESRFCGGCHEDRAATTVIQPGITQAVAVGPTNARSTVARFDRASTDFSRDAVVGVPWDQALQPIFDANCVSCHDGTPGPANPSYTITDPESGMSMTWTFDLRGQEADYGVGDMMMSGYSASHLSLMGPDMMDLEEAGLIVEGEIPIYVEPNNARESILIQKLNPVQQYPTQNTSNRAFATTPHLIDQGQADLTADEYHLLVLMADAGGQFYSRENAPGQVRY